MRGVEEFDHMALSSKTVGAILAEAGNPANECGRPKEPMLDKTNTIVVIESHEQTVIRRSRRLVSSQLLTQVAVAQPLGIASSEAPEPSLEKPKARWWLAVAVKGVNVFSHWSRRLKRSRNERRNKQP
jgi:hypothetical protein